MPYEYEVDGKKITLDAAENLIGVRYKEPAPHSARAEHAQRLGAQYEQRFEVPNEKYTVLRTPENGAASPPRPNSAAPTDTRVARFTPVFNLGKTKVLATDRVLVGLSNPDEPIAPLLRNLGTVNVDSRGYGEYTVHLAEDVDPLAAAKQLAQSPQVAYAEPDFVNIGSEAHADAPRDNLDLVKQRRPLLAGAPAAAAKALAIELTPETISIRDYLHHVTISRLAEPAGDLKPIDRKQDAFDGAGQANRSLPYAAAITMADKAWELQAGDPGVRIAILDEGVDTRHPDLRPSIVASYDSADGDEFQEPNPWDGHGTACAGLAAGLPSNANGVRGIGAGCSIMAVRIAYSEQPGGPWVTTNSGIARAVDWSWRNHADVLSNSWGGGAPSNAIVRAFNRARTHGRKGKGCVIVVACGNDAREVSFPANVAGVLSVSATNEYDEFKTKDSRDGEDWWGSNFGPEVSIGAPGVHNYTTDITGVSGYNSGGDYFEAFNGTSAATPLVAGACALLVSAKPGLTESEIRRTLEKSADKVGATAYTGGRNDQLGFGRLNVFNALSAVLDKQA